MTESGMPAADYRDELDSHAGQLMAKNPPSSYSSSAAATVQINAEKLANDDAAAMELASLCAFFESAPIPDKLLISAPAELPALLAERATNRQAWRDTIVLIRRHSLADIDRLGRVRQHRVTQAILRDRLAPGKAAELRACADALLVANNPGDPGDPATWAEWAALMPHLLAADPAGSINTALRSMACAACLYFLDRGSATSGHELINRLYQNWRERLGEDDPDTSTIVNCLMRVLGDLGSFAAAKEFAEKTWDRRRRVLGEEHPQTLTAASCLAIALSATGEKRAAKERDEATLAVRRRVLGEDHQDTLASASNLAADLSELEEWEDARVLAADTLARRQRRQGDDHPDTLKTASNLATTLAQLGQLEAAKALAEDTLARRGRVLGKDHPATLITALNLADMLADLGKNHAACELAANTLPRLQRFLGADHPFTLACAADLARFNDAAGEAETVMESESGQA